ncbi:STAS domain-containing protein [Nocardioides sp.]|uniref:STAS domain-containing protein n=1 Tax=Nocardioides sp. TaxID=35761 RepID=UPI002600D7CC|nr:STAS domain-containing protein [Nocardioides sp.]
MPFTIRVLTHPPTTVVEMSGELDVAAASALRTAITRTLDAELRDLQLDLRALTFVDAAGLQALARAHAEALVRGARLEVTDWGWALDRVAVGATARAIIGVASPAA